MVELSMMLQGAGSIVGALLCNWLADKYGRKIVFLTCMWSNCVLATVQAFSPSMTFYTVLTFLDGLQQQVIKKNLIKYLHTQDIQKISLFPIIMIMSFYISLS